MAEECTVFRGKYSCDGDGIGRATKWEVTGASLESSYNYQILSQQNMFKFCSEKILGIKHTFVSIMKIIQNTSFLKKIFEERAPIPGTRGYHRHVTYP